MSEKITDYLMLDEYKKIFKHLYHTEGNKELFKTKTSENFSGISKHKNRVIGITKNKIISYNFQGKYEGYMDFYNNAKKVLLTSHSNAYVLENGNINKIKIKNLKKD